MFLNVEKNIDGQVTVREKSRLISGIFLVHSQKTGAVLGHFWIRSRKLSEQSKKKRKSFQKAVESQKNIDGPVRVGKKSKDSFLGYFWDIHRDRDSFGTLLDQI